MSPALALDVVSIFPDYLAPLRLSLVGRAIEDGLLSLAVHDLRAWTHDRHRTVDDAPYGGGPGMVMKPEPWGECLDDLLGPQPQGTVLVIPSPSGARFDQAAADRLAHQRRLVFACGRYEGIDARVAAHFAERLPVVELSIGDYVLAGGEAAVLVMVEAVARLVPGVLGNADSAVQDSFAAGHRGLLEAPAYTRPQTWRGLPVPAVLQSGNHAAVAAWRREQSQLRTARYRPDLLAGDGG
jgi:tRNA (guanine37-N1)-methyltransferase